MESSSKDIIKKIQKLLALAERAGSDDEAANAMRRVAELLEKHKLSMSQVNDYAEDECEEAIYTLKSRYIPAHIKLLNSAMCLLFDCKSVYRRFYDGTARLDVNFIGMGADPIVACQTFGFLLQHAQRKSRERKITRADKRDYFYGFAWIILDRVKDICKERESSRQEYGLVPVGDAAIQKYLDTHYSDAGKSRSPGKRTLRQEAIRAGMFDGMNASLDRQVETTGRAALEQSNG